MIKPRFNSFAGVYYRKIQIYMKKAFKQMGISFEEGIVLQNVLFNPGTTQDRIAAALVLDAAAVARSLKSLEQKGYLTRSIDRENQRRKRVNILPAGRALAERINRVMDLWDEAIFQSLSGEQVAAVVESASILQRRSQEVDIPALLQIAKEKK